MNSCLKLNYHDANLDRFEFGPRRALNLLLFLDDVKNSKAIISFRAIENYEEVSNFFANIFKTRPVSGAFLGRIEDISLIEKSRYVITFDDLGSITIVSKKITETTL